MKDHCCVEHFRGLLGNQDGMELEDADGSMSLYISPDRVRARKDLGLSMPAGTPLRRPAAFSQATPMQTLLTKTFEPPQAQLAVPVAPASVAVVPSVQESSITVESTSVTRDEKKVEASEQSEGAEVESEAETELEAETIGEGEEGEIEAEAEQLRDIEEAEVDGEGSNTETIQPGLRGENPNLVSTCSNRNRQKMRAQERKHQQRVHREALKKKKLEEAALAKIPSLSSPQTLGEEVRSDEEEATIWGSQPNHTAGDKENVEKARRWFTEELKGLEGKDAKPRESQAIKKMVKSALSVGGPKSMEEWQTLFRQWRLEITIPDGGDTPRLIWEEMDKASRDLLIERQPHLQKLRPELCEFYRAWNQVNRLEADDILKAIIHRLQLANVREAYNRALSRVTGPGNRGQSQTSRAKVKLFRVVYPDWAKITQPMKNRLTRSDWEKFNDRLKHGKRWSMLRETLGMGVFALMPTSIIPHRFVERNLKVQELELWAQMIHKFNPDAVQLGKMMETRIKAALMGQKLSSTHILLEDTPTAEIKSYPNYSVLLKETQGEVTASINEASRAPSRDGGTNVEFGGEPTHARIDFPQLMLGIETQYQGLNGANFDLELTEEMEVQESGNSWDSLSFSNSPG